MSILKKVKAIFKTDHPPFKQTEMAKTIEKIHDEVKYQNYFYYGQVKITPSKTYQTIKAKSPREKVTTLFEVVDYFIESRKDYYQFVDHRTEHDRELLAVTGTVLNLMLRQKLEFKEEELIRFFNIVFEPLPNNYFISSPVGGAFKQIEKFVVKNGLSDNLKEYLLEVSERREMTKDDYYGTDYKKLKHGITKLINDNADGDFVVKFLLSKEDSLGKTINAAVDQLSNEEKNNWYNLFQLAVAVKGGKPTNKYLKATKPYIDALGRKFKPQIWQWLEVVINMKEEEILHTYEHNGRTHHYTSHNFIEAKNANLLKGLVWTLVNFHDKKTLDLLARLTERSFKKIPGVGPAAAALGNASIYVLAQSRGLVGVSHLSRLKLKIQQNNTRKLIQKYVTEQSGKLGISAAEIEDLAVPDYGLVDGKKTVEFKDYQFVIEIIAIGKVKATWIKPDGKTQKSVPAFVNQTKKLKDKLKAVKAEMKLMQKYLTAQRDRVDRNYIQNRTWKYADFKTYYLEHGLMNFITKGLIWNLEVAGKKVAAIYRNEKWETADNQLIEEESAIEMVSLWHPVEVGTEGVLKWRDQLETWQIKQPFKQAYREVYILTDAEVNTRLYSNRMAAHILKQHQFNALAGLRGWKYALMGWYDDGRDDDIAEIQIPAYNMTAEFWIGGLNEDDAFNEAGIWHYVTTDQVRFRKLGEPMELIDVPKLVFSEIMRDVDMFVGVASVGNDPQWADNGGLLQHRDYWQSYSFGDLTELAKTRKAVLEKLVPRLKIRTVAEIDGKFLKIKGKIRNYKIHIGSTNILMEPNDQYLCIVPSRKKDTKTEGLFLPFEGDRGLSVVLSKAFMLMDDDKITDETITSQIDYR